MRWSRFLIVAIVVVSLGSVFWQPTTWWQYALDIVIRAYVMFIGTVMAHDGTHGHLARSRTGNTWWGRLALLPVMVTHGKFRRTHLLHHAYTNHPDKDPDYFLAAPSEWELPIRAILMPHTWLFWMRRHNKLNREDMIDHLLNGAGIIVVHAALLYFVGVWRYVFAIFPAIVLLSFLLWYPFGVKTHEGYSQGEPETRSHNYYGKLLYWFSWGLSLHRVHHMFPQLTWMDLGRYTDPSPRAGWRRWLPHRDIRATSDSAIPPAKSNAA